MKLSDLSAEQRSVLNEMLVVSRQKGTVCKRCDDMGVMDCWFAGVVLLASQDQAMSIYDLSTGSDTMVGGCVNSEYVALLKRFHDAQTK